MSNAKPAGSTDSSATLKTHKDPKPENVTWVSPHLTVSDVDTMAKFYEKAFKFQIKELMTGEDGSIWHGELRYKDQLIMLGKAGAYGDMSKTRSPKVTGVESPMNLYLYCEDVDQFYKDAIAAGASSLTIPQDLFWGDRMCRLQDPDGYTWCFATKI